MFASGVFLFLSLLDKTGRVGRFVVNIFYGIFGSAVTVVIMLTVFVLAWCLLRGTEKLVFSAKTIILYIAFVLFLASLIHTLANNYAADYAVFFFYCQFRTKIRGTLPDCGQLVPGRQKALCGAKAPTPP